MAQGGQVPCLLSALLEYAWGVFPAVLHHGYRAPWKELRCTPNWFFNSYSSKSKLCGKPSVVGQLWPFAQFLLFLKESLKSSGVSVELYILYNYILYILYNYIYYISLHYSDSCCNPSSYSTTVFCFARWNYK